MRQSWREASVGGTAVDKLRGRIVYCLLLICLLFISYLVLLLQVLRRYHKFAGCRRSRRRGQAALSGHPVEETHNLLVAKRRVKFKKQGHVFTCGRR